MRIKDVAREKVLTEIIAERDEMVLDYNGTITNLQKENEGLKNTNAELTGKVKELEQKIESMFTKEE